MTTLSPADRTYLRRLVRAELRKTLRSHERLKGKFGEAYNPSSVQARQDRLSGLYRKLGGNPDRVEDEG